MINTFHKILSVLILLPVIFCMQGCNKKPRQEETKKLTVAASIVPQKYFIKKIGGDFVDVTVMVAPGASPHVYEPKPSQIKELSGAKLYFAIGIEFERVWLPRFSNSTKGMIVIHLDEGIEKIAMEDSHHGNKPSEGESEHSGPDPHIWLSPQIVKGIAEKIADGLCSVDSLHCKEYHANKDRFVEEIDNLQREICDVLKPSGVKKMMVFHPSWGYFAREFNLTQISIELEGKEPHAKELAKLINIAHQENIKTIFTQPQFSNKIAITIASQINGKVLPIDPLAYNWDSNLRSVVYLLAGK